MRARRGAAPLLEAFGEVVFVVEADARGNGGKGVDGAAEQVRCCAHLQVHRVLHRRDADVLLEEPDEIRLVEPDIRQEIIETVRNGHM